MKTTILCITLLMLMGCKTQVITISNIKWKLVKMYGEDFSSLTPPVTLQFAESDNTVNGFAGCNRFFGSYEQTSSSLKISGVGSTKMFCQETMAIEDKYFKALQEVQSFTLEGKRLSLFAGQKIILEFKR